jgi:hypothetical protein
MLCCYFKISIITIIQTFRQKITKIPKQCNVSQSKLLYVQVIKDKKLLLKYNLYCLHLILCNIMYSQTWLQWPLLGPKKRWLLYLVVPQNIDFEFIESENIDAKLIEWLILSNVKNIENLYYRMSKTLKTYFIEHLKWLFNFLFHCFTN